MTITLMPAGTTRDPSRDEDIIDRIAASVAELGLEVKWGCQIVAPKKYPVYTGAYAERRVMAARNEAERLPRVDCYVCNDESAWPHWLRARRIRAINLACMGVNRQPITGNYGTPRCTYEGEVRAPSGWVLEILHAGLRYLHPTTYIRRDTHPRIDGVMKMGEQLVRPVIPYVSGQINGDERLVPSRILREQAKYHRNIGITDQIVWCNIETPQAVDGVRNVLEQLGRGE